MSLNLSVDLFISPLVLLADFLNMIVVFRKGRDWSCKTSRIICASITI